MPSGFAPYLLKSMRDLAAANYPGIKVTRTGFLELLLKNSDIKNAKLTNEQGHQKTAKVKYKQRISPSMVTEDDNCDIDFVPSYKEADLTAVNTAKIGFHISLETVSKYLEEASAKVIIGTPATPVINEISDQIAHTANALLGKVNQKLLSQVVWGMNVVEGNNAATVLNLSKDNTKLNLDQGYAKLLNDAFENELVGNLLIAGAGKMNAFELTKASMVAAQNGVDMSRFTGYNFFPDLYTKSAWGTDYIGVFEKGAIHFVDFERYVGFQAGKLGNSTFFQITLDVNGTPMKFDAQLKEIDCPTEITDVYNSTTGTFDRGYALFLKKTYGLFQLPADSFQASDALVGVNGAIRYQITNTCEECD